MLKKAELEAIHTLRLLCEETDGIQLKLNWGSLRNREERLDFFHYEDNELVGFLGLYPFGSTVEVCGMVSPSHRRKKVFTRLFEEAMELIKEKNYEKILLNTPAGSLAGKGFLSNIGAVYVFSESQMKWQPHDLSKDTD